MRAGTGKKGRIIVGLDIGTTKICCIVSSLTDEGMIDVIGLGVSPSRGLRKGVVVNIESTVESIKRAVEEAELMAGVQVNSVYVGIAGSHITGFNSRGYITIQNEDEGVTQADKTRAHEKAKPSRETFPKDREEIHTLPQAYIVDDQDGIKDPLGICGRMLEVDVYIITGAKMAVQNVKRSVQRAGLDIAGVILQPLASSKTVLTSEETELGVAMVDLGGGTTDLAIYSQGSLVHTAVLPIGGNHLTQDVAVGLRISQAEAEKVKVAYGSAMSTSIDDGEMFEARGIGGRPPRSISRKALSEILEPRAEEVFELVGREITQAGHEGTVVAGLVLSGGTALLHGIADVAERVLDLPVRVGSSGELNGLRSIARGPSYATAVGLILEAWRPSEGEESRLEEAWQQPRNVFHRIKEWFF